MVEKSVFDQPGNFINRELSWMEFNKRILGEARDKQNPLFEDEISEHHRVKSG